ncbi:hypothetical protein Tco_0774553 [Tanacetum coccineum]|uniref:Uncharacterized protein n=1 Tax=Tanacetum coccineum TaxID=301880 RepID=A0ABQ4ZSK5_9ASTR
MPRTSSDQLADNLHDVMMETLPSLVKEKVTDQVKKEVPAQVRDQVPVYLAKGLILERKTTTEETKSYMSGHILHVHPVQVQSSSVQEQQHQLYLAMKANPRLQQQDIAIWYNKLRYSNRLALRMKFEQTQNSAKRQKTSEYEAYVSGESSFGQDNVEEPSPSTSGNQEQDDEFDLWTDSYASDDDEIPTKQVSQDIMKEISLTIDKAKLNKMADDDARQNESSWQEIFYIKETEKILGDEGRDYSNLRSLSHQDIMGNFLNISLSQRFGKRANGCIVSITEPDYKNLNKNDIEGIVHQELNDMGKRIEEYDVFSIVYEPVHRIIYTNNKKEKRVMRPLEIHKFCDATLRRTLEGLKSYYNDVKYGYVQKELTNDEVEFLKLFEEEIEVRLNYRDQMRGWEMYVNGRHLDQGGNAQNNRPLGSRMLVHIKGKKNDRMMLEYIEKGPLVYPNIEEDGKIREKKYAELTEQEKLQDDCDFQATNIVLQGLSPDVYSIVNHCKAAKDI